MIALLFSITLARVCGEVRDDCFCGVANYEGRRITNGDVTKPWKYPWMVTMLDKNERAYCGGSLISDRHVSGFLD
jgi:secreted trypsin-like serine protease